jgi:uncharacterized protein
LVLPDVNVLLYAFHPAADRHSEHKVWLDSLINGEVEFGLSPQILNSVVRIATTNAAFRPGYQFDHVAAFCDDLLAAPMHRMIQPGRRHWRLFCDLCRKTGARGNLAQVAWFAALAMEHDCEWITHDTDFGRFPGLRWRPPF